MNLIKLQEILCKSLCADIRITKEKNDFWNVETPFYFSDGDSYQIYLQPLEDKKFRITDAGHTYMQLSYESDITAIQKEGTRKNLLENIKTELEISEENGVFYLDSTIDEIHTNIFKFAQAITKIMDISFLNKTTVKGTFYEDLRKNLYTILDQEKVTEDFVLDSNIIQNSDLYPIDYKFAGKNNTPVFLFGVHDNQKALLTTLCIQVFSSKNVDFEIFVVFENRLISLANKKRLLVTLDSNDYVDVNNAQDFKSKLLNKAA